MNTGCLPHKTKRGGDKMSAHYAMFYFHVWLYVAVVNAEYVLQMTKNIYDLQRTLMGGRDGKSN
jgi:hypothetical protein